MSLADDEFPVGSVWRAQLTLGEATLLVVGEEQKGKHGHQTEVPVVVLAIYDGAREPPGTEVLTWSRNFSVWERLL